MCPDVPDPLDDRPRRILLAMAESRDARLLREWFEETLGATVVDSREVGPPDDAGDTTAEEDRVDPATIDCCVFDRSADPGQVETIRRIREAQSPVFVPTLLVTPSTDRLPTGVEDRPVDDVVETPVRKAELRRRVDSLLRTRSLSLDLAASKQQYRHLVQVMPAGVLVIRDGRVVYANDTAMLLFGEPRVEEGPVAAAETDGGLVDRAFRDLIVPADRDVVDDVLAAARRGEGGSFHEVRVEDPTGADRTFEMAGMGVQYEGQSAIQVVVRDLTERKHREEQLELYRRAMDEARIGITITDARAVDNPLVYVNDEFVRLTGRSREDLLGRNPRIPQCAETDEETRVTIRDALDEERPITTEIRNERADGRRWWNRLSVFPVENGDGEVTHFVGFQEDVTEERRQREELASMRTELSEMLERIDAGFFSVDDDWTITFFNDRGADLVGRDPDEVVGQNLWDAFPEAIERAFYDEYHEAMDQQTTQEFVEYFPPLDTWFEVAAYPSESGLSVYFRDVTDRIERERRLRESEERFREMAEVSTDTIVRVDEEGRYTYVSPAVEDLIGRSPESLVGEPFHTVIHEDDVPAGLDAWDRLQEGEDIAALDLRLRDTDGEVIHVEITATAIEQDGAVVGVQGTIRDVTDRIECKRQLEESERRFRAIAETSSDTIIRIDTDGRLTYVSPAVEDLIGRTPDELLGETFLSFVDANEHGRITQGFERALDGEAVDGFETYVRHADGESVPVEVNATPIRRDGVIAGVQGTVRDITERRERDHERRQYETIVQTAGDPIVLLDDDCRFVNLNATMTEFTGYDRGELLGEHLWTVIPDHDVRRCRRVMDTLADDERETVELHVETATGEQRLCELALASLPGQRVASGDGGGTVGVLRDLTERRQREQRLAVLDRILRHNLRNKLNLVQGRLDLVTEHLDGEATDDLAIVEDTIDELLALSEEARQFRDVVDSDERIGELDLVPLLEAVVAEHRNDTPEATITLDLPRESLPVLAYDSIALAFDELVENAVIHHDGSPTVRVTVDVDDTRDGRSWVTVEVTDDGPGVPEQDRLALDEAGESALQHGSGLGLWIVNWTTTKSGGEFTLREHDEGGTVGRIRLRCAGDPEEAEASAPDRDG